MAKTIIHFIHELGDGGASTLVKDYSLLLREDGFNPVVIVTFLDADSVNYNLLNNSGIKVHNLYPKRNLFYRFVNKIFHKQYISKKLMKAIYKYKPIAIHCHLAVLKYIAPISHKIEKSNIKLFHTCHSLPSINYGGKNSAEKLSAKKLIASNDLRIIALHENMKKEIDSIFHINSTLVIKNGINFSRFSLLKKSKKSMLEELGIPQSAFIVGHIGRFSPVKNHSFLIKVFKETKKRNNNAFLLLVGTGPLELEIKRTVIENNLSDSSLVLTHRDDVPELLSLMDVFVFPSVYEGFGMVLIEAQFMNVFCVTSNNVPDSVILTKNVISLSLDDPMQKWVDNILIHRVERYTDECFKEYDLKNIIMHLENLYLGSEENGH